MQILDFTSMMEKYPLLTSKDVSFLNKFFNREDIQLILSEIEENRKTTRNYYLISMTIIFIIVLFLYLFFYRFDGFYNLFFSLIIIIAFLSIIVLPIISYFIGNKKTIKKDIIPEFVKNMNAGVEYSQSGAHFKDSLASLMNVGLLKKFTRVDFKEDSIKYIIGENIGENDKSIEITGAEIKTSEKRTHRTKNGTRTYYVVTNHCYLMKVNFKNPRFVLKNSIRLIEDIADNYIKKFFVVLGIQAGIILGFINIISGDENSDGYLPEFLDLLKNNIEISFSFFIGMFAIIWFIYSYIKGHKRVKLENIEFEKEFDVYSDDQIESRKLLTPSFMYRLVDFVNKISHKRVYEMYFHDNYFYIKYNILRTNTLTNGKILSSENYMEFSNWKNVFENLEDYVEFFLELKNITFLSKDLKLFYYDKGMMSKEIIK